MLSLTWRMNGFIPTQHNETETSVSVQLNIAKANYIAMKGNNFNALKKTVKNVSYLF